MKLSFNMSAIIANNQLNHSDSQLADSLEKLSSGYKINHAKDNPAGISISRKMRAQIKGLSTASDIATNGTSVIATAEGALAEMHSMLQRMKELAVQASNGTCTTADRNAVQEEVRQLSEEIERLANQTDFNGNVLLDGSNDLKGYTSDKNVKIDYYSDQTYAKNYSVTIDQPAGSIAEADVHLGPEFPADAKIKIEDSMISITASGGFEIKMDVTGYAPDMTGGTAAPIDLDITGLGAMTFQIGANEGQVLDVRIPEVSLKKMNMDNLDMSTEESAKKSMDRVEDGIAYISAVRSRLGAYENRLESTISSLAITEENMNNADSRIMDTDMAEEMSNYTKYQTLSQAGISMLSQANERPEKVLQLLQ